MINKFEDKTIEFLEFTLDIIQMYDKDYLKERHAIEQESRKTGKQPKFNKRIEIIRKDFDSIIKRYALNGAQYVKATRVYKLAGPYGEQIYDRVSSSPVVTYTKYVGWDLPYSVVIHLNENILLYSLAKDNFTIILKEVKDGELLQKFFTAFNTAKVTLEANWIRFDYDCDGKVSFEDIMKTLYMVTCCIKHSVHINSHNSLKVQEIEDDSECNNKSAEKTPADALELMTS